MAKKGASKSKTKSQSKVMFNMRDPEFFRTLPRKLESGDFDKITVRELKSRIAEAGSEVFPRDHVASLCSIAFALAAG